MTSAPPDPAPDQAGPGPAFGRIPATWLVLTSILSLQVGAAFAKDLFAELPPTAMAWLRLAIAAVILVVAVRPRLRGRSRADWLTALAFGAALTAMNVAIYNAFARIPLGIAVTIEFCGPLLLAVVTSRRPRDLLWVALAAGGVALLGLGPARLDPWGVAFALIAGAIWAGYIVLSGRVGRRWSGLSGLAVAGCVGAIVLTPPAIAQGGSALLEPRVLLLGLVVALMSSVIPYSLELIALRTMPARVFGILMSLEPAAAAVAGVILLAELLEGYQWVAIALVVVASVGATRRARDAGTVPVDG